MNWCYYPYKTVCGLRYLGALLTKDCLCPEGQFGMGITNGCICYNGIIPGSQANVQCNVGYQLLGNSTQLLCQGNGLWSDMQPRCEKRATSQGTAPIAVRKCVMGIEWFYFYFWSFKRQCKSWCNSWRSSGICFCYIVPAGSDVFYCKDETRFWHKEGKKWVGKGEVGAVEEHAWVHWKWTASPMTSSM